MNIPRPEHPRMQLCRETWLNLNGIWQFETDNGCSGEACGLSREGVALGDTITVPFCPESRLSGISNTDFMSAVWYKRTVFVPRRPYGLFGVGGISRLGIGSFPCRLSATDLGGMADALLDNSLMMGMCYTQLTDVEQEQNGLYTYDRRAKFDMDRIRAVLSRKSAIEE